MVNVSSIIASKFINLDLNELTKPKRHHRHYQESKLCQILFTIEFAKRFNGTNVTTFSVHPGLVKTNIFANLKPWEKKMVDFFLNINSKVCLNIYFLFLIY